MQTVSFAGSIGDTKNNRLEVTRFWNTALVGALPVKNGEVEWLPVEEARKRLPSPLEQAFIERVMPPAVPIPGHWDRQRALQSLRHHWWSLFQPISERRLAQAPPHRVAFHCLRFRVINTCQ